MAMSSACSLMVDGSTCPRTRGRRSLIGRRRGWRKPCGGRRRRSGEVVSMSDSRPVAVYDSGVGGLTVARAILDLLPGEPLLYVGDTARMPYGPRPVEEIRAFALEVASYVVSRDVKMLVVACNSVEVSAIDEVTAHAGIPVLGVIDPGVRAALRATRSRRVGVVGTEATIASGAYERAVARTRQRVELRTMACPAFVDHVERGDTSSDELLAIARRYLEPLHEDGI